ncbi:MAG: hypothetical protein A3K19_00390 [Lentisphaerae bacterium RIFOXYB12_FULL_65_16]|nr:MAG: hypothetical protein A3K18_13960 [Lentisphaerae bacterium RIFOXYA12_64_32]OGV85331.1 MAG: hypothetical protein A3K19_00390 [Lentisphaerae bacterium RIFOXYB12_FULL_65_16]
MKTALAGCIALAFSAFAGATVAADATRPELSVWYRFEAPGELGHSFGTAVWPATAWRADAVAEGKFGSGIKLSGAPGNGLYLPNPVSFFGADVAVGTIALWVRPDAIDPGQRVIIDFMKDAGNTKVDGYETVIMAEGDVIKAQPCLGWQMQAPGALRAGEWTHVTLTWDSTTGTALYVNGAKVADKAGKFTPTPLDAYWPGRVGCHTPGGGYPFAGTLDELRLLNRRVSDADVLVLKDTDPAMPQLQIEAHEAGSFKVRNTGATGVALSLDVWEPGRQLTPPFYGFLPTSFTRVWTAGAAPCRNAIQPVPVSANGMLLFGPHLDPAYLGPHRLRLMTGVGLAHCEVRADELLPTTPPWFSHLWNRSAEPLPLVRRGLDVAPLRPPPATYMTGSPAIEVTVLNDLGRHIACELRTDVRRGSDKLSETSTRLRLGVGERRTLALPVAGALGPGEYQVRHEAILDDGTAVPLSPWTLFITEAGTLNSICDVAAAYTTAPDDEATLQAMASDGIAAVRLAGKQDPCSIARNLSAILRHGMRALCVPAASYRSVCTSPASRAELRRAAADRGAYLRDSPGVLQQLIAGEGLSHPPCYCESCVQAFRTHLQVRYLTLDELNRRWGSNYGAWDEIQPLGSPKDVDETAERLKIMKVAMDLPQDNTQRWKKLFELDRPRAIEWKRWHDQVLVDWYQDFALAFLSTNGGRTPISESPCWPNFESHILFALGAIGDNGGMDLYLPGDRPTSLGYPAELFLNFDMNRSIFESRGKPLMVHELYVQDNSPVGHALAQGWWLTGRGYTLLTYFTYNYYLEGTRNKLPLVFALKDKEGKPYPCYESFCRFSRDIKAFQSRFDAHSLRCDPPQVALFMGDDVSLANALETGGAAWEAAGVHGHNGAYWLTERNGFATDFVNDAGLTQLEGKRVLIVPWCHVIRETSLLAMAEFARRGGTVVFDGAIGLLDDAYRPYAPLPGGSAFSTALSVSISAYDDQPNQIRLADGRDLPCRGIATGLTAPTANVLLKDAAGNPALIELPVGKGRVVWFLSNLGRMNLSRAPAPAALDLWRSVLEKAGVAPRWRLVPDPAQTDAVADPTQGRKDVSLFDASVRSKDGRELFVFLTSFFGPTKGDLLLTLPDGAYSATDAQTDAPVDGGAGSDGYRIPVDLPAFGTRVLHITAAKGAPFKDW